MPTGARLLVERLKAHGVDTIFGIPGIHNLAIYDALFDERGDSRRDDARRAGGGPHGRRLRTRHGAPGRVSDRAWARRDERADRDRRSVRRLVAGASARQPAGERHGGDRPRRFSPVARHRGRARLGHAVGRPAGASRGHRAGGGRSVPPLRHVPPAAVLHRPADGCGSPRASTGRCGRRLPARVRRARRTSRTRRSRERSRCSSAHSVRCCSLAAGPGGRVRRSSRWPSAWRCRS